MKIVFASTSPTRRKFVSQAGLEFEFASPVGAKELTGGLPPEELVKQNALNKALAVAEKKENCLVIGCDTVVFFGGKIIGKPRDGEHAKKILLELGGNWHEILTGVAVVECGSGKKLVEVESTRVKFKKVGGKQIDEYVESGEPLGKAGAYAVQEKGGFLVEKIEGSYSNIVGAPLEKIVGMLKQFGVEISLGKRGVG